METVTAVFSGIGAIANAVMAIAAAAAFFLWRKQVVWTSHHQLARELSGALRMVSIALNAALSDLQVLDRDDEEYVFGKDFATKALPGDVRSLDDALKRLGAFEGEVDVLWGHESWNSLLIFESIVQISFATLMRMAWLATIRRGVRR